MPVVQGALGLVLLRLRAREAPKQHLLGRWDDADVGDARNKLTLVTK